jgi:hypothetical protein
MTGNVRQKRREGMKIGYVRVSKQEQHEALQVDALSEVGCEKWFLDKIRFHQFKICIYSLLDLTREARRLTST